MARAESFEVRSLLSIALDTGHLDEHTFEELKTATEELSRVIGGLGASLSRARDEQRRHRSGERQ